MPPFVKRLWANGRENAGFARWSATEVNNLEERIFVAIGEGAGSGLTVVNSGTVTVNTTLPMDTYQDVLWVVTVGANVKLEIGGWATGKSVTLIVKQDATGSRTVTLPTAKWDGGAVPVGSTLSDAIDIRAFFRGTTETYGFESGTGMA